MDKSMCRVCLVENVRMQSIVNTKLQEMYEQLTAMPFETKDNRSVYVCYLCCAMLQKCHQLKSICLESEELLTQMFNRNMVRSLSQDRCNRLKISQLVGLNIDPLPPDECHDDDNNISYVHINIEPFEITETVHTKEEDGCPAAKTQIVQEQESSQSSNVLKQENLKEINGIITNQKLITDKPKKKHFDRSSIKVKRSHKCHLCDKCFTRKQHLISHIHIHTNEKQFECSICEKRFNRKSNLNTHARMHTGEKPFVCTTCRKCFNTNADLSRHLRVHTGERPYRCAQCDKCFTLKGDLTRHIRIHSGEKPFQCNICGKCFNQNYDLNSHIRRHTGEKPYRCILCDKRFSVKSGLSTHIRTHTGEKPYQCDLCEKCFSDKSSLNNHVRIHTGEKPYQCDVCEKCFRNKHHLHTHKRIHTGERPYQCDTCKKCFNQRRHLNTHIRTHTT